MEAEVKRNRKGVSAENFSMEDLVKLPFPREAADVLTELDEGFHFAGALVSNPHPETRPPKVSQAFNPKGKKVA